MSVGNGPVQDLSDITRKPIPTDRLATKLAVLSWMRRSNVKAWLRAVTEWVRGTSPRTTESVVEGGRSVLQGDAVDKGLVWNDGQCGYRNVNHLKSTSH